MARKYKAVMHFSKPGSRIGRPWTVHYRGVCHVVRKVVCLVPMTSEYKPEKATNPRAFFTAMAESLVVDRAGVARLT